MEIIPAIDLREGMCVRLYQGDYAQETVYSSDPVKVALKWQKGGAHRLHIVDLDGARTGRRANAETIAGIASAVKLPLQVGGGVRSRAEAERLLELGVDRVVLGTLAVQRPQVVAALCRHAGGERVVVAVDAREGRVAVKGWRETTSVQAVELVKRMADLGVQRFLYTDIARDGTLTEPNFQAVVELVRGSGLPILASGGISSPEHLRRLVRLGVEGAVLGKALYARTVTLAQALRAAVGPEPNQDALPPSS